MKVCVRYVKDGEERRTTVPEVGVVIVVVIWTWMEGNWWSIDASGSLKFISMGEIPERASGLLNQIANTTQQQPCCTNRSLHAEEQSTPWLTNSKFLTIL